MERDAVPKEVSEFIDRHIPSVGVLESLLLLRSNPERRWTADELSEELRTSTYSETKNLEFLRSQRFIVAEDEADERRFRYRPATDELNRAVRAVADMYRVRRVTVINLIYPGPSKPRDAMRDFANAFRFTEKKKNG